MTEEVAVAYRNHFSLAKITWKINNISLWLCNATEAVVSPDFVVSGRINTVWRMHLTFSDVKNILIIKLKLLDHKFKESENDSKAESATAAESKCSEVESEDLAAERKDSNPTDENSNVMNIYPEAESNKLNFYRQKSTFKVNWIAYFFEKPLINEETFHFEKNIELPVSTFDCSKVLQDLSRTEADYLEVKCFMLVDFEHEPPIPRPEILSSILSLSEALLKLPDDKFFSDIEAKAGNLTFHLHKDMLFHRGDGLHGMVTEDDSREINFLNYDGNSLGAIFRYLYSGQLEFILNPPRLIVCDHIERLGISELEHSYAKERIIMESNVEGKEFVFNWKIDDFETTEDSLNGPELYAEEMESRWQLHVYPKGLVTRGSSSVVAESKKNFVVLAATLVNTTKTLSACLEFASIDENGKILFSRRVQGKMNAGDRREVDYFPVRSGHMKKCLTDKALLLRFTVRLCTGSVSTAIKKILPPSPSFIVHYGEAFCHFSSEMLEMFTHSEYPDLIVSNGKDEFQAHRFIMAANSESLNLDITCHPQSAFPHRLILIEEDRFIEAFLEFLYTGVMSERELDVCSHLYELACRYNVSTLLSTCKAEITKDVENFFVVLDYADDINLSRVKTWTISAMASRGEEVVRHHGWTAFKRKKPELAVAVREEMRMIYLMRCGKTWFD